MSLLNQVFHSVLQASLHAGILVFVVLAVQALSRNCLAPRWRYGLWLIVLLRLALPATIESRWSLFTWLAPFTSDGTSRDEGTLRLADTAWSVVSLPLAPDPSPPARASASSAAAPSAPVASDPPAKEAEAFSRRASGRGSRQAEWLTVENWLSLGWIAGAMITGGWFLVSFLRLRGRVSRLSPVQDGEIVGLLGACRCRMGVRRDLTVHETDLVSSPGLFGFWLPRVLLPLGFRDRFTRQQVEHIFLHELAHLKRGDLLINGALLIVLSIHWFNPLVWVLLARSRVDRELACDALVLSRMDPPETRAYGQTIIRLVEVVSTRGTVPGLIGMREDASALRQRIRMIARFRRPGRWSLFGVGVVAAMGVVSLTDAQLPQPTATASKVGAIVPSAVPQTSRLESVPDLSWAWQVSGHVLDATTLQPIPKFRVTVGGLGFHRFDWESSQIMSNQQGRYSVLVPKRIQRPGLEIEAEGYLPVGGAVLLGDHSDLEFKLAKGTGPQGTVLLPDGRPATDVPVTLVQDSYDVAGSNSGWTEGHPRRLDAIAHTRSDGTFSLKPSRDLTHVLVDSWAGWALVSVEQLKTQPLIHLEAFSRLRGVLRRGGQGLPKRGLMLSAIGSPEITLSGLGQAVTDAEGRYEFERVPPGTIRVALQEPFDQLSVGHFATVPLAQVVVRPEQVVTLDLDAPNNGSNAIARPFTPPSPERISGAELTGLVLLPSGSPASRVEVAVVLPGRPILLGRGRLGNSSHESGEVGRTGTDGRFALPLFEGASSVVAVGEAGITRVSIDAFRASPILRLEPWAEIRGTLEVGGRLAPNATLSLSLGSGGYLERDSLWATVLGGNALAEPDPARRLMILLDPGDHCYLTDAQGRYRMLYVPPGEVTIRHHVGLSATLSWFRDVAEVSAEGGRVIERNLRGHERKVQGRLVLPNHRSATSFGSLSGFLENEELLALRNRMQALGSAEERSRLADSPATKETLARSRVIRMSLASDGTVRSDVVPPGRYALRLDSSDRGRAAAVESAMLPFVSELTVQVPERKVDGPDQVVDLGTIQLRESRQENRP